MQELTRAPRKGHAPLRERAPSTVAGLPGGRCRWGGTRGTDPCRAPRQAVTVSNVYGQSANKGRALMVYSWWCRHRGGVALASFDSLSRLLCRDISDTCLKAFTERASSNPISMSNAWGLVSARAVWIVRRSLTDDFSPPSRKTQRPVPQLLRR